MKKILLAVLLLTAGFSAVQAQDKKKEQFQWSKATMDALGVSAEVQSKINDIKKSNDAEIKKVKDDGTLTEEQRKEKLKELRKQRMDAIEALLTPEEKKKADEMKKEINKRNKK